MTFKTALSFLLLLLALPFALLSPAIKLVAQKAAAPKQHEPVQTDEKTQPLLPFKESQTLHTLSGKIFDNEKSPVYGATVYIPRIGKGAVSDFEGNYSILLPEDTFTVRYSSVGTGYEYRLVSMNRNQKLDVVLTLLIQHEVEVKSETITAEEKVQSTQMSMETLTAREAKLLPALFGEVDLIKVLQLKPGVQSGGEGSSGLYIRGGGPDQNLVLTDLTPVYNPAHLFGFFSIFNPDAVKNVNLYKGGFPAQYGGRLSSVVDVKMRSGDPDKYHATGGLGLISSRLTLEGPINKGKSTFIISGRRTYFDIFTREYNRRNESKPKYTPIPDYYFYDLNGKFTFDLNPKDKVSVSAYYGQDIFNFGRDRFKFRFNWGNTTFATRWNHEFNSRAMLTTSVNYTDYSYKIQNQFDSFKFQVGSGVTDYTGQSALNYLPTEKHNINTGISYTLHNFEVGRASGGASDRNFSFNAGQHLRSGEFGAWVSDDYEPDDKWKINAGARISGYNNNGVMYGGVEPRSSVRYALSNKTSLKASYTRMYQYTHLVSSSGASLPTDIWYPSNATVRPQVSDQEAVGFSHTFMDGMFLFSNELYYKNMQRQIDFKDGANLFINNALDTVFVFGRGWAYGSEFYLEKTKGKLTGWVGYTLSYTWRQFKEINNGDPFHPRYDRRHDISVVAMYALNKRISLSATFVYGTGQAVTLPTGRYFLQDIPGTQGSVPGFGVVPVTQQRSNVRMAPYHRMDIAMVWKLKPKHGESDLTFSIYNVYSRMNPYFLYIETVTANPDGTGAVKGFRARQVSLFPIIPSVTYNFRF
ncbi:MAG: carboxypeptidase-like regulatory domain-containing protein [Bacteroidota bacterium]